MDQQLAPDRPVHRPGTAGGTEGDSAAPVAAVDGLMCADCGQALEERRWHDGTVWPPLYLAHQGRERLGRVLCWPCYVHESELRRALRGIARLHTRPQ